MEFLMDVKMNTTNNYGNLWVCEFSVHYNYNLVCNKVSYRLRAYCKINGFGRNKISDYFEGESTKSRKKLVTL